MRGLLVALVYLCLPAAAVATPAASPDPLLGLIAGEFALQEGQTAEAADRYAEAALASADARLVERATRLALMAGDLALARRLLGHWRTLAPEAPAQAQVALALALREADADAARAALDAALAGEDGWKPVLQAIAGDSKTLLARTLVADLAGREAIRGRLEALLAVGGLAERMELPGILENVGKLAVERHPGEARAWLWQAEVLRKREDLAAARVAIDTALALPTLDADLRMTAAGMLAALGDAAAAAATLAAGEQNDTTWAGRAAFLSRIDDRAGIEALYAELQTSQPEDKPARLYLLGQLAELLERPAEARDWYGRIPPGERADAAQLRLAVLADQEGDTAKAVAILRGLQQRDSDHGELLIDAYLLEAELLGRRQRHAEAIEAYSRGLAVFEDDATLLYARALAYERSDRIDEAEADLRLLITLDPENTEALNALGYTLADRTERFAEAHELIRMALARQPDNPAIIDSMGWVLFRMGRVEEALPHLRRAFELQRDAEIAAHLGEALWAAGKQDEARTIWRLGLEIDAGNRALKRAMQAHGVEPPAAVEGAPDVPADASPSGAAP
jgi:tetratricopeptide (TPR) repeat protein